MFHEQYSGKMPALCRALAVAVTALAVMGSGRAAAQSAANLLVVINTASADSDAVGRHYIARRAVPSENVCLLVAPTTESITRAAYESQIERPIWKCIADARAHDRILYIVLTKGVPIRITGTGGRSGTTASVDSELTLLYRRRVGRVAPVMGFVPNPYFAGSAAIETIRPFAHDRYDIYLVTRLDGYSVHDVEALIDKGMAPARDGRFVLDERGALLDSGGDTWLREAAQRLRAQGLGERVVLDESTKVLTQQTMCRATTRGVRTTRRSISVTSTSSSCPVRSPRSSSARTPERSRSRRRPGFPQTARAGNRSMRDRINR